MCDKVIIENGGTLMFIRDSYKNQKVYNKVVDNHAHVLAFVPNRYKTQAMCNKVVDTFPSAIQFVLKCHKIQEICDKAIDGCLPALKFVPDGFVTKKLIKKLYDLLLSNDNEDYVNEDSGNVKLHSDEMGIFRVDLSKIKPHDVNSDKDELETITHVRLMAWCNTFKQRKEFFKKIEAKN